MPIDFYTNMMGVLVDQHILKDMLSVKNLKLTKHFAWIGLDPTILSMQWFVTLYANTMHYEVGLKSELDCLYGVGLDISQRKCDCALICPGSLWFRYSFSNENHGFL